MQLQLQEFDGNDLRAWKEHFGFSELSYVSAALDELGADSVEDLFYVMDGEGFLTACNLTVCDKNRASYMNPVAALDTIRKFAVQCQSVSCLEALDADGGILTRSAFLAAFDLGDFHFCELLARINCASAYLYGHAISSTGQSVLHRACREGRISTVMCIANIWMPGLFNFRRFGNDWTPLQVACSHDQQQIYHAVKNLNGEYFRQHISNLLTAGDPIVIRKAVEWDYVYIEPFMTLINGFLYIYPALMEVGHAPKQIPSFHGRAWCRSLLLVADFGISLSPADLSSFVQFICGHGVILTDKMVLFRQFMEQGFDQSEFERRFMDTKLLPVAGNQSRMLLREMGLLG